jgi:serine/threonine protein kinase
MVTRPEQEGFGRFRVLRPLGEGAQGRVYLAHDPHLDRQVAIKTLLVNPADRAQTLESLLAEARTVGKLQHPNIVALHDAGEQQGEPYLVFEYVAGATLQEALVSTRIFARTRAVETALQILEGIHYAHGRGIVHRDLKPANIMLDEKGLARIMDFGVAASLAAKKRGTAAFAGTPLYAAPEYLARGDGGPLADVFSVGAMLYEMLAGRTVVRGDSLAEIVRRATSEAYTPASQWNREVDQALDGIVMRAVAQRPEQRYPSAQAMIEALRAYLSPPAAEPTGTEAGRQSTLNFLLRRMKHKSDFPALSEAISAINRITASDTESVASLSNVILKDFALTNKLLRLVNTAVYGQFGGVSTVSRAVVIMGFEAVRSLAISLLMLNHLQNKSQAASLQDEIVGSFFSGILAKQLTGDERATELEEAFICAMFLNLGKLLATFYFYEEAGEISKRVEQKQLSETAAATEVLGISYEELGIGVAEAWNFPAHIIHSMRALKDGPVAAPKTPKDRLRIIANLAGDVRRATQTPVENRDQVLRALSTRYAGAITLNKESLGHAVERSLAEFFREVKILDLNVRGSRVLEGVGRWVGTTVPALDAATADGARSGNNGVAASVENADIARTVVDANTGDGAPSTVVPPAGGDAKAVLTAGIQEITNTLVGEYSLSDLLRMIMETMYRGIGFSRVLLCIRDVKQDVMVGRFGFGQDAERLAAKFRFPMAYEADVFHVALAQGRDIYITDTNADSIRARIPEWYRTHIGAAAFVLFPIVVDKKPVGMIYGDQCERGALRIESAEANLLKTLRNQAVLGFKQKS